jgi:response regulator NasT
MLCTMNTALRIVVADDEPDMRQYFQRILPRLGHKVVAVAENGRELVDLCSQHEPDLVITDIFMPVLDGLAAVRAVVEHRPVPVIVVSALGNPSPDQRADMAHVMCQLVKPVRQSDLESAIQLAMLRFENLSPNPANNQPIATT